MKKLSRDEMKNLKGGIVMTQSGYSGTSTNCFCDYHYQYSDGSHLSYCNIPCAGSCCSSGYGCSLQIAE